MRWLFWRKDRDAGITATTIASSEQVRTELRVVLARLEGVLSIVEGRLLKEQGMSHQGGTHG